MITQVTAIIRICMLNYLAVKHLCVLFSNGQEKEVHIKVHNEEEVQE